MSNDAGKGFILVNPYSMHYTSDGTATSVNLSILVNATNAVTSWNLQTGDNTAYPAYTVGKPHSSFLSGVASANAGSYRLVSAGIRIRYIDTLLNRAGRFASLRTPDDANGGTIGGTPLSFENIAGVREADYGPIDADWITVVYSPQHRRSLEYMKLGTSPDNEGGDVFSASPSANLYGPVSSACLVIMLDSAGAGRTFEYEVTANYEVVGLVATSLMKNEATSPDGASLPTKLIESQHNHSSLYGDVWQKARPAIVDAGARLTGFAAQIGAAMLARRAMPAVQRIEL